MTGTRMVECVQILLHRLTHCHHCQNGSALTVTWTLIQDLCWSGTLGRRAVNSSRLEWSLQNVSARFTWNPSHVINSRVMDANHWDLKTACYILCTIAGVPPDSSPMFHGPYSLRYLYECHINLTTCAISPTITKRARPCAEWSDRSNGSQRYQLIERRVRRQRLKVKRLTLSVHVRANTDKR